MKPSVVVVGGGYAGILIAQALDTDSRITLVDPRDAFVNYSASLRALTRPDWAHRPFFDYRDLLHHGRIVQGTVTSADPVGVTLATGDRVDGDYLVLATGSTHSYPAHPQPTATSTARAVHDLHLTHHQLDGADRVLILGAGPVGLELAGEIRDVWPTKTITIVDPNVDLLPGFLPAVRQDLHRQLSARRIDLRLATSLTALPATEVGTAQTFTVTTSDGDAITADIWFRAFGSEPNTAYLRDGLLVSLTERRTIPVDEHLNVLGHKNVYALGDIADTADAKMATHAQTQAAVVIDNLRAQLRGEQPMTENHPAPVPRILLPLGAQAGVGQLPDNNGDAIAATLDAVIARKGSDLFTARFQARFDPTAAG